MSPACTATPAAMPALLPALMPSLMPACLPMVAASWTLPATASSVPRARRAARGLLAEWDAPRETGEAAELLVSELVTNAVRHAHGPVVLSMWARGGRLRCEVADADPRPPRPRHAGEQDEGSRGLELVQALADAWGSTPSRRGKIVWFELAAPGRA
ncbi:ATP-binding protein [Nonomuraea sp. LP-02]|uniref:ATP-binding protein n=1 Tax=Nonomuraea sp. LP-02 TaxID=3097960 RepID=UPI002E35C60F|nr:ATP-binding protein [Nonomuraea sp. LP-02]MED7924443.1 ATP-binding protein [Nonomuraea sp. LP-02]